jgi:hypothetical protein
VSRSSGERRAVLWRIVAGGALLAGVGAVALATSAPQFRGRTLPAATASPAVSMAPSVSVLSGPTATPGCETLQARVDAAPAGSLLDLTGCTYTAGATIRAPLTLRGVTIRVPAAQAGLVVLSDDVTIQGARLVGAGATTYDPDAFGVMVEATAGRPVERFTIRESQIDRFGGVGIYVRGATDLVISANVVRDVVYAGIMVLSGRRGLIEANSVLRIGVNGSEANSGNAYGIALTKAQGNPAENPVTSDVTVTGNTVEDVPTWHALDTHAGQRIAFAGNTVRRSSRALFITTDESGNRPTDVIVTGNRFLAPAPVTLNLKAVTTYSSLNVRIDGNTASGWPPDAWFEDYEGRSTGLVLINNFITPSPGGPGTAP